MDDIPQIFPIGAFGIKDYSYLTAKEISNPGIEFPERLRAGIQNRKQLVTVILEKRRTVVGSMRSKATYLIRWSLSRKRRFRGRYRASNCG